MFLVYSASPFFLSISSAFVALPSIASCPFSRSSCNSTEISLGIAAPAHFKLIQLIIVVTRVIYNASIHNDNSWQVSVLNILSPELRTFLSFLPQSLKKD